MKPKSPAEKLSTDEVYTAVVRAVWYHKLPAKEILDQLAPVIEKHGKAVVQAATTELLDHEGEGASCRWFLKPELHKHCRAIKGMGFSPEEWATCYLNADGTPMKNRPHPWPPHRKGFDAPPPEAKPAAPSPPCPSTNP